jgi:hypothetical protein
MLPITIGTSLFGGFSTYLARRASKPPISRAHNDRFDLIKRGIAWTFRCNNRNAGHEVSVGVTLPRKWASTAGKSTQHKMNTTPNHHFTVTALDFFPAF